MGSKGSTKSGAPSLAVPVEREAVEADSVRQSQRDAIIHAALELLDEAGLEDFSMRKLATRVGMSAGNLYLYFEDRDGLLDSVRDAVLDAINTEPIGDGDWPLVLKQVMHHYRNELQAHPGAMVLLQRTTSISPGMWQLGQILTEILSRAGISDPAIITLYSRVLLWTLSGFVAQEEILANRSVQRASRPGGRPSRTVVLSAATLDLIMSQPSPLQQSYDIDVDELFEATIDVVIRGIASVATGS
ncbi:MAG: TetR/AcrR family transcriptional regulator [Acidobacteriota bacterium]|nr:TetR/AcrR family transcriptional regulator [Acidobacteriota bacterium]